jgi:mono/diheme cytochrome c family protein
VAGERQGDTAAIVGGGYESDMPGFEAVSDAEVHAVLAYIKSTWPDVRRQGFWDI